MNIQERMRMCNLIDQMENKKTFSDRLGLDNKSTLHGYLINNTLEKKKGKDKD